jgi:hypothetical protein
MLDGVYIGGDEGPQFVPAPPLTDDDVQQILAMSGYKKCRPARSPNAFAGRPTTHKHRHQRRRNVKKND